MSDTEPQDPRRDCPWKCAAGDPKCACAKLREFRCLFCHDKGCDICKPEIF